MVKTQVLLIFERKETPAEGQRGHKRRMQKLILWLLEQTGLFLSETGRL